MRNMFADTFFKAGQKNKKLAVIVADISPAGSMEKFHRKFRKVKLFEKKIRFCNSS